MTSERARIATRALAAVAVVQAAGCYVATDGLSPGGDEVMPSMALQEGTRLLPAMGNVQHNTSWTLQGLAPGVYYWSTQAIDGARRSSTWAPEQSFVVD